MELQSCSGLPCLTTDDVTEANQVLKYPPLLPDLLNVLCLLWVGIDFCHGLHLKSEFELSLCKSGFN